MSEGTVRVKLITGSLVILENYFPQIALRAIKTHGAPEELLTEPPPNVSLQ